MGRESQSSTGIAIKGRQSWHITVELEQADAPVSQRQSASRLWEIFMWTVLIMAIFVWLIARWYSLTLTALFAIMVDHFTSGQSPQTLVPFVFDPLPLGSIKPQGWLRDQMQLMADGLAGHEHDFYRFVAQSSWLGGNQEYSQLNEGFPYWFNGIVPLAYGLDDDRLKGQIRDTISTVLSRRASDGWIGPEVGSARNFWARYPLFLGMIQLLEADSSYGDTIIPAMHDFVGLMNSMLKANGTGYLSQPGDSLSEEDHGWGRIRVADMMITLQWLYEHNPNGQEQMLLENLDYLRSGAIDWAYWYQDGVYIKEDLSTVPEERVAPLFPYEHGVNVGQGLKAGAVVNRFTDNGTLVEMARRAVDWTFKYHGAASGTILADERLKGLGPYYGSELCTTVETMYSLSYLYQALGDNSFADRAEVAAFNALPVALTPDWWAHQYVTQPNQPYSKQLSDTPFWNVNGWGQSYGLEPNYPCCTVNHPQGYPKFLSASFVKAGDNSLAHALLSPGTVTAKLSSGEVTISCETNYPFSTSFTYTITSASRFDFHIRIPSWALSTSTLTASSSKGSSSSIPLSPDPHTGLHTIPTSAGTTTLHLTLTHQITTQPRANASIAVFDGPLLYALELGASTTSTPPKDYRTQDTLPSGSAPANARDYQIENTTPWNVAIDPGTLTFHTNLSDSGGLQNPIWAPGAPPTWVEAKGCLIDWPVWKGVPGPVPAERVCLGDPVRVRLVPYGSAKIHMAELPTVSLD